MGTEKKPAEYEKRIKQLEGALDQAQQESQLIQAGAKPGAAAAKAANGPRVDIVEHQALRQEVEALRKRVTDLQQELGNTNEQARQAEDQLEDKNALIENLNRDIEGLQNEMKRTEDHRQRAEEAKLQSDTKLSVLQERMEAGLGPLPEQGAGRGRLGLGLVLGAAVSFIALEAMTLGMGKGELIGLVMQEPRLVVQAAETMGRQPAADAQTGSGPAPSPAQAIAAEATPGPVPGPILPLDGGTLVEDPDTGYTLVSLKGGSFQMGDRVGTIFDETPMHEVRVQPFLIGRTEVTFDLYDRFAKATGRRLPNDNGWGRGQQPVVNISWNDAQAFAKWMSELTGKRYRLPTEAEWEYVAGAGRDTPYWWGTEIGDAKDNCFNCNSPWDRVSPAPVNSFSPNPFGLVSTAGNVQEWVADCYRSGYAGAPSDGSAVEFSGCPSRVIRGGAFNKPADSMKRTRRSHLNAESALNNLGLRLAREP